MSDITDLEDKLKKEKVEVPVDVAIYIGILKGKTKADKDRIKELENERDLLKEIVKGYENMVSDQKGIIQRAKDSKG